MDTQSYFIVGGSSGIGLEIVRALHQNDHDIYVGSRSNEMLAEFDGLHFEIH